MLDADGLRGRPCELDGRIDHGGVQLAGPDVGQRHSESGWLGNDAVGHRQRVELSTDRERVDRQLRSRHELVDEHDLTARCRQRRLERLRHVLRGRHHRQAALSLAIRRLDHAGKAELLGRLLGVGRSGADTEGSVWDARLGEPLALAELRHRRLRHLRGQRMPKVVASRHARCEADGKVDARRDDALDPLRGGQPVDRVLVLDGDDRPPVGVAEAWSGRIAIDGDDVDTALLRRLQQPELPSARP